MFDPPRCPHTDCPAHHEPGGRFFRRHGAYWPKCRPTAVPRFLCLCCRRTFSRQTLRSDYHDHKPHLNQQVLSRLCSGSGLRQTARELGMAKRNLDLKARKIATHLEQLHHNLMAELSGDVSLAFDEMETFEGCRSTRPLTVPVLIEQESTFLIDARSAPIRPSGRMTPKRRRLIAEEERRNGRRRDGSRRACARVLATAAKRCAGATTVRFRSDYKTTYPKLLREAFGADRVRHLQVSSKLRRDHLNPLHRINLTLARMRDLLGRLHRRSWLVTKRGKYLDLYLMVFACYRNYHCVRFNGEKHSPAELLGFLPRRLTKGELLSWRQDWGPARSPHPLSPWLESVDEYRQRTRGPED
jgi:transposase-like protein